MGYKRVLGRIVEARVAFNDVRLDIDVLGSRIKNVFKGDMDLEKLRGVSVKIYVPQIETAPKMDVKKEKKIAKGFFRRFMKR